MANTYDPSSLGIKAPSGGFQTGGWYEGRQYWGGTLSDPGVIHPSSNQQGAGQLVSQEVNLQSDAAQGNQPGDIERYLEEQRRKQAQMSVQPTASYNPTAAYSGNTGATADLSGLSSMGAPVDFNLPDLYKSLYESSGISELENTLMEKERAFTEAKGKINDNPYLSEATRVGRVAKLEQLHAERTKNDRDAIATKKADIETQLNLQTKQFDIESQAARDALDRFNLLLSTGALSGASGESIAQLTRMTGIPSDMIYSAINYQAEQNRETEVITSTNDAGVVTVSVIDPKTGQVVNQQSLGAIGNKQGGGTTAAAKKEQATLLLAQDIQSGVGLMDILSIAQLSGLDISEALGMYNRMSPHGTAYETRDDLIRAGFYDIPEDYLGRNE